MSTPQADMTRVADVALPLDRFPIVGPRVYLKTALERMETYGLGVVCVCDDDGVLQGVLTDGDLRRKILHIQKPFSALFSDDVIDHCVLTPTTIRADMSLQASVALMGQKRIWDLPVVTADNSLVGLLHLHPAIEAVLSR